VNIPVDNVTNKGRGYAIIEFVSADALRDALKFNNKKFMDKHLRVYVKKDKKKTKIQTQMNQQNLQPIIMKEIVIPTKTPSMKFSKSPTKNYISKPVVDCSKELSDKEIIKKLFENIYGTSHLNEISQEYYTDYNDNSSFKYLFHGTSKTNTESILRCGYIQESTSGQLGPGVYCAHFEKALNFARDAMKRGKGDSCGVLKLQIRDCKIAKFQHSEELFDWRDQYGGAYASKTYSSTKPEWVFHKMNVMIVGYKLGIPNHENDFIFY
jgi:hypothetical protein